MNNCEDLVSPYHLSNQQPRTGKSKPMVFWFYPKIEDFGELIKYPCSSDLKSSNRKPNSKIEDFDEVLMIWWFFWCSFCENKKLTTNFTQIVPISSKPVPKFKTLSPRDDSPEKRHTHKPQQFASKAHDFARSFATQNIKSSVRWSVVEICRKWETVLARANLAWNGQVCEIQRSWVVKWQIFDFGVVDFVKPILIRKVDFELDSSNCGFCCNVCGQFGALQRVFWIHLM